MTIKKTIVSILLAGGCAMGAFAQNGLNDPMTKAMMEVYDQEITANPQAYDVYFRRANEYYKFNQYLRALSDIDSAIKYAPQGDADFMFQCLSLRGDIYQMLGKTQEALNDFTEALKLDPTSFMALPKSQLRIRTGRLCRSQGRLYPHQVKQPPKCRSTHRACPYRR